MKILLSILFFLGLTARLIGAVVIENIDVLNDPGRLDQYILERVDNGDIGARATPAVDDREQRIQFKIAPQKTYFGLIGAVPAVKFEVINAEKITASLWGNFYIEEDAVFQFGGSSTPVGGEEPTPVRDPDGNFSAGVDGWFQFLPFRAKLYGAIKTSLYAQSRWGDLEKVAQSSDDGSGEFTFDPVYAGRLVLASFTIAGGVPQGYDFINHRLLTTSEMTVYLRRFQGDVMLTTVGMNEASLKGTIHYWVNQDTGEALGTVPLYEVDVERTGDLQFTVRLETFSEMGKEHPEIVRLDVQWFKPDTQQWVGIEPVMGTTDSKRQVLQATVRLPAPGIYRFLPEVIKLTRARAKG